MQHENRKPPAGDGRFAMTDSRFYGRLFALAAAAVLAYLLFQVLAPLREALGWAAVLAFMLHPLHRRLARRLRDRPGVSAGILTAATPIVVLAPLTLLGVVFIEQAIGVLRYLHQHPFIGFPALLERAKQYPLLGPALSWLSRSLPLQPDLHAWLAGASTELLKSAAAAGGNVAFVLFGTVISFFMMLFLLFFLLRDGEAFVKQCIALVPLPAERRDPLLKYLADVTRAVVYGSTVTAIIQGLFVAGGFALAGLPSPLVFGVVATIASLLPAGAMAVLVPAVLYLVAQAHWGTAIFLALWSAGLVLVENVIRPFLTAHRANVSILAVFVGAVGGVSAFGVLGLVLGPVLLSFVVAIVRFLTEPGPLR
ncbi:MAG: AI-2E family transporter [Steroidobacteraceae bacterium]